MKEEVDSKDKVMYIKSLVTLSEEEERVQRGLNGDQLYAHR